MYVQIGGSMNSIGLRIKYYWTKIKKTQEQLAEDADVSVSLIAKVETNYASASINTIIKIAKALEVPVGYLIESREEAEETRRNIINRLAECEKFVLYIVEDVIDTMITSISKHMEEW